MQQIIRTILAVAVIALVAVGDPVRAADEQTVESSSDLPQYRIVREPVGTADAETGEASTPDVVVPAGTRVPLVMINSVSSKHSQPGDPVYLQSVYPVVVAGRVMIPAGTNVSGTVVHAKRPGRVKGRGELGIRVDQMILPNGVIRDLSGRPGALDGRSSDNFDRETGTVKSPGTKGEDGEDVANATISGATLGTIIGSTGNRTGTGLAIGSIAGAGAGLAKILLTRGPDTLLSRGTHLEIVLEQNLHFSEDELKHLGAGTGSGRDFGPGPDSGQDRSSNRRRGNPIGIGRLPL